MFFFRHQALVLLMIIAVMANAFLWWIVFRYVPETQGQYVLHFSFISGVDVTGTRFHFYLLPFVAFAFGVLNMVIAIVSVRHLPQLAYLIASLAFLVQGMALFVLWMLLAFNRLI